MNPSIRLLRACVAVCFLVLSLSACSVSPHKPDASGQVAIEQRAQAQQLGTIEIRASVPGDEEARALFGIPLDKRGIQAVWLEITNNSPKRARFAPYSLDPDYFPPHEVAYMFRKNFSKEGWQALEQYLFENSMPRNIGPGETRSGYVFTNTTMGTKAFNVDVFYTAYRGENEHFTFFVDVPGFTPDHADIDFKNLYPGGLQELDQASFRELLSEWPCCTTDYTGDATGRPVKVIFVGRGRDLLQALLRAEWSETSYKRDDNYLKYSSYYFERPPDAIFRKGRESRKQDSIELAVWLAPVSVDGVPVWVVSVTHAIGRLFEIGEYFFGIRFDPDTNNGRNYVLQDLWYGRSLESYAWSQTGTVVPETDPVGDFNGNVWFSDGYRLVLWLSGEPVDLKVAKDRHWDAILATGGEAQ
jgi:hypothetical protein